LLISIITVNFNNAKGLQNTIVSVQNQTYINYEHIIIDGDSNDGSKEVIEKFKSLFSYWVSEPDYGIYNAMNKGIIKAKGEYLLFLNSGDILFSEFVLTDVSKEMKDGFDIYYGDLIILDENMTLKTRKYPQNLTFHYFFDDGHLPHPASFTKKMLFDKLGLYREKFKIVSDWDFYVNAICRYNATYKHLDVIVSNFQSNGISSKKEFKHLRLSERKQSLEENFSLFLKDNLELLRLKKILKSRQFSVVNKLNQNRYSKKIHESFSVFLAKVFNVNN
jgi:glycosyltransferase involved in cell wall biosynthesis